jgi:D-aminopeptidase
MKLYVMTDLEGVAGVVNGTDYIYPSGRYYETARRLLTEEVNAAVRGFISGGFDDVVVADGHGPGAINAELLDTRVRLLRGWPAGWPLLMDESYDALAFVGQHAKAGTENAHLPHTQWFGIVDLSVNGVSIGEYGQSVLCADELNIPVIFASGDAALCREAAELTPSVETVEAKVGTAAGRGDELDHDAYGKSHEAAIHRHPSAVRGELEQAARTAALRFRNDPQSFGRVNMQPPYRLVVRYRQTGDKLPHTVERTHADSVAAVFNSLRA